MKCQCQGIQDEFDDRLARRELKALRRRGPRRTTRLLLRAVESGAKSPTSAIDIGGGVGAIQLRLAEAGVSEIYSVDASPAYVAVAREEAIRRGFSNMVTYLQGDFVDLADRVPPSDFVTLDRVLCCYDDIEALVRLSAERARVRYGLVYPRHTVLTRLLFASVNWIMRIRGSDFRGFLHEPKYVELLLEEAGFRPFYTRNGLIWQVIVFERQ